jgi:hypothetical protein
VITPLNQSVKPDLEALLAIEEAKEAATGTTTASPTIRGTSPASSAPDEAGAQKPVVSGDNPKPPGFDPNSISL